MPKKETIITIYKDRYLETQGEQRVVTKLVIVKLVFVLLMTLLTFGLYYFLFHHGYFDAISFFKRPKS